MISSRLVLAAAAGFCLSFAAIAQEEAGDPPAEPGSEAETPEPEIVYSRVTYVCSRVQITDYGRGFLSINCPEEHPSAFPFNVNFNTARSECGVAIGWLGRYGLHSENTPECRESAREALAAKQAFIDRLVRAMENDWLIGLEGMEQRQGGERSGGALLSYTIRPQ